jgi:hypothetical protein
MLRTKVKVVEPEKVAEPIKEEIREVPVEEVLVKLPVKEIKEVFVRPKLSYRNIGGTFRMRSLGLVVKCKETFMAYPEQIPAAFKKTLICISDAELQKQAVLAVEGTKGKEDLFVVEPARTVGWFNVVNSLTKKMINEKSLYESDAVKLCNALNN